MKKIFILIIFSFLLINSVSAEEEIVCSYSKEDATLSVRFKLDYSDDDVAPQIVSLKWDGAEPIKGIFYNMYSYGEYITPGAAEDHYINYYNGDYDNLFDYYSNTGSCPPYALTFPPSIGGSIDTYLHVVVLSDYNGELNREAGVASKPQNVFELNNPPASNDSENAESPKMFACQYDIEISYVNNTSLKYNPEVTFDTQGQSVSSSLGFIIGNQSEFINYMDVDCSRDVYICASRRTEKVGPNEIFISKDLSTMLNDGFLTGEVLLELHNNTCPEGDTEEECLEELASAYGYYCGVYSKTENPTVTLGKGGCYAYDSLIGEINSGVNKYDNISRLKSYCNTLTKYGNYNSNEESCMYKCLNINKYLPGIDSNNLQCGLSERLIIWIANIVKWLKYIIPVIVMVLGILDFIKAISSDKEEEMKKAQASFVKRLIACALIFIIPFIIEFVLNKMGFDANGCGIIDL